MGQSGCGVVGCSIVWEHWQRMPCLQKSAIYYDVGMYYEKPYNVLLGLHTHTYSPVQGVVKIVHVSMDWLVGLPDAFQVPTSTTITIALFLLCLGLLYR